MRVDEVMRDVAIDVHPRTSLPELSAQLDRTGRQFAIVSTAGHLVGLVPRDRVARGVIAALNGEASSLVAADVMIPRPVTVSPSAAVERAKTLMVLHGVDTVVVVDADGHAVGLVRAEDLDGRVPRRTEVVT